MAVIVFSKASEREGHAGVGLTAGESAATTMGGGVGDDEGGEAVLKVFEGGGHRRHSLDGAAA
jgi:hypothetical protein